MEQDKNHLKELLKIRRLELKFRKQQIRILKSLDTSLYIFIILSFIYFVGVIMRFSE